MSSIENENWEAGNPHTLILPRKGEREGGDLKEDTKREIGVVFLGRFLLPILFFQ